MLILHKKEHSMKIRTLQQIGIATFTLLIAAGCGGGGSSGKSGKAYYVDAAVSGINYECGSHKGVTDSDGGFVFESGKGCSLYIGDAKLRDIDSSELADGKKILETDVKRAQLLQTLDNDGNPSNGITITPAVAKSVSKHLGQNGAIAVPTSQGDLDLLHAEIQNEAPEYGGRSVTENEAHQHLAETENELSNHDSGHTNDNSNHTGSDNHNSNDNSNHQNSDGDHSNDGNNHSHDNNSHDNNHNGNDHSNDNHSDDNNH